MFSTNYALTYTAFFCFSTKLIFLYITWTLNTRLSFDDKNYESWDTKRAQVRLKSKKFIPFQEEFGPKLNTRINTRIRAHSVNE